MRTIDVKFECKALAAREFEGYGSVFGNVDLGGDVVIPGAFARSLADHKNNGTMPSMFWMHQMDRVPGAWSQMREDEKGLYVRGKLADTELGDEMRSLLRMNAVAGLSIGFQTKSADYDREGVRRITEVDLWEVSLVSLAMNPLARVESSKSRLSSDGIYVPTAREFEEFLHNPRDSNIRITRKAAKILIAKLYGPSGGMLDDLESDLDSSGMLEARRRDAGKIEPTEHELLAMAETIVAGRSRSSRT